VAGDEVEGRRDAHSPCPRFFVFFVFPFFFMSGCTRIFHLSQARKFSHTHPKSPRPLPLSSALSPPDEELDERHPLRP
jgi:hypothetical protein